MTQTVPHQADVHALPASLAELRLPSMQHHWQAIAGRSDAEGWSAAQFLAALTEIELAGRQARRIERNLRQAGLPPGKTLATFDFKALTSVSKPLVSALCDGQWLENGGNLIAIGNSGTGKSHLLSAIGHALVENGKRVLYMRATEMVQKLQAARNELVLEAALNKLARYDLIILDDITYAHKDQAESSVLFELISHRYEHRSLAISANRPFSAWGDIFPDQAMTVAAIDRLVHHATILEMNGKSYRQRTAEKRASRKGHAGSST